MDNQQLTARESEHQPSGYCLNEKKKVEIKDPKYKLSKFGRPVVRGICPSCGGVLFKILKCSEVPATLRDCV